MKTFEKIDKPIFGTAVIVYLLIFAFIVFFPSAGEVITKMMNFTLYNAGEIYILAYAFFFIVLLALAFGKFGRFRLGKEEDRPEYSFMSWIAMLVGAGIGCGLIFYGVNEPMTHFMAPPYAQPGTAEAPETRSAFLFIIGALCPGAPMPRPASASAGLSINGDFPILSVPVFIRCWGIKSTRPREKSSTLFH